MVRDPCRDSHLETTTEMMHMLCNPRAELMLSWVPLVLRRYTPWRCYWICLVHFLVLTRWIKLILKPKGSEDDDGDDDDCFELSIIPLASVLWGARLLCRNWFHVLKQPDVSMATLYSIHHDDIRLSAEERQRLETASNLIKKVNNSLLESWLSYIYFKISVSGVELFSSDHKTAAACQGHQKVFEHVWQPKCSI